jgi:hypothetical protein
MCYVLNVEKILFNYFAQSNQDGISFNDLNDLSCKIIKECKKGIVVRINKDEIENVILKRPTVFAVQGSFILLIDKDYILVKNVSLLNRNMPLEVWEKCIKVCKQYAGT